MVTLLRRWPREIFSGRGGVEYSAPSNHCCNCDRGEGAPNSAFRSTAAPLRCIVLTTPLDWVLESDDVGWSTRRILSSNGLSRNEGGTGPLVTRGLRSRLLLRTVATVADISSRGDVGDSVGDDKVE